MKLFLALDFHSMSEMQQWLSFSEKHHIGVKIGLEAFTAFGPDLVREARARNLKVFLDLKFHDIPTTVIKAMDQVARLHVDCFSLHAQNGDDVWTHMRLQKYAGFAVTALTSLSEHDVRSLGWPGTPADMATTFVKRLLQFGQTRFICSAHERTVLRQLAKAAGVNCQFIVPGVRVGSGSNDQSRVAGVEELKDSADTFFVLGRTITQASDPEGALHQIVKAMG